MDYKWEMVFQYAVKITNDMREHIFNSFSVIISEDRKNKIKKYVSDMDKLRSLLAEVLLRYALYKHYNLIGDEIVFSYNAYGKPLLKKHQDIHFNLSHAGNWVLCGIGNVPLGIDIEYITNIDIEIAKRFFNEKEYIYLLNCPEQKQLNDFFKIWTLKESYIKEVGKGLNILLNSFYFDIKDDEIVMFDKLGEKMNYCFSLGYLDFEYYNAICISNAHEVKINQTIFEVSVSQLIDWKNHYLEFDKVL